MAASYPTSAKTFTTKTAGATVEASHVNDLQDEVTALEQALLSGGLAHNVFPTGTRSLGTSSAFWNKTYTSALILSAETTSGIRIDVNGGVCDVREGDDSAAAPLRALRFLTPGAGISAINDDGNAFMTTGLTVNQGGADDEILALKSSDVAHGMTDVTETDTFGLFKKVSPTNGGWQVMAFTAASNALNLEGCYTTDTTTKTTAGTAAVTIDAKKKSSATVGAPGADANLVAIRANGTTRFIFDAEGSAHADVEWTTFDTHDDLSLLDTLDRTMHRRNAVTNAFGETLKYNARALQDAGIVNFYSKSGKRAMVNFTRLAMLHTGALRQIGRWMQQADARLSLMDRQVAALGA